MEYQPFEIDKSFRLGSILFQKIGDRFLFERSFFIIFLFVRRLISCFSIFSLVCLFSNECLFYCVRSYSSATR